MPVAQPAEVPVVVRSLGFGGVEHGILGIPRPSARRYRKLSVSLAVKCSVPWTRPSYPRSAPPVPPPALHSSHSDVSRSQGPYSGRPTSCWRRSRARPATGRLCDTSLLQTRSPYLRKGPPQAMLGTLDVESTDARASL
ncbi:hypothetical protein PsYK624_165290 [Phanerochaete sordida]|uniref:Uncharacterized protein n=1 Tax=Phanerochaete sordida TaxID=48140 RepID=A0A9P3GST7_9APHY|nr:hypothetical protein PsYK624_165290 [Phanerochaete sordida]